MTVYELLTVLVAIAVGIGATVAIYLGLLNWVGRLSIVRCAACHHLTSRR